MNKIQIQGKDYIPVNERIMEFRRLYPDWSIRTEILESQPDRVRFLACIVDNEGRLCATGHAEEKEGSTFINKTSYVENAETSAVGRALGMLGIGIDTSLASFEEVANAMLQKDDPLKQSDDGKVWLSEMQLDKILERFANGERDVIDKALVTFKMKKEYRDRLLKASENVIIK